MPLDSVQVAWDAAQRLVAVDMANEHHQEHVFNTVRARSTRLFAF